MGRFNKLYIIFFFPTTSSAFSSILMFSKDLSCYDIAIYAQRTSTNFTVALIHNVKVDKSYLLKFSQRSCEREVKYFS